MDHVLSIGLRSMDQDQARLDRIALNLVNLATPGYRREVVAQRPFLDLVDADLPSGAEGRLDSRLDSRAGALHLTGQPLDLALTGGAFFEVATEQGPAYTRQGNLRLDAQGRLVTAQGLSVMGRSGDIFLTHPAPRIESNGAVYDGATLSDPNARPVAYLKLVTFEHPESMIHLGEGLLSADGPAQILTETATQLRQGALENANVNHAQEMVSLMQTMRHFESMARITQGYNEILGVAIQKLGDLS